MPHPGRSVLALDARSPFPPDQCADLPTAARKTPGQRNALAPGRRACHKSGRSDGCDRDPPNCSWATTLGWASWSAEMQIEGICATKRMSEPLVHKRIIRARSTVTVSVCWATRLPRNAHLEKAQSGPKRCLARTRPDGVLGPTRAGLNQHRRPYGEASSPVLPGRKYPARQPAPAHQRG